MFSYTFGKILKTADAGLDSSMLHTYIESDIKAFWATDRRALTWQLAKMVFVHGFSLGKLIWL